MDELPEARVEGIDRELMEGLFEICKETHPNEFGAALRKNRLDIIDEFWLPPGAREARGSVSFQLHNIPHDPDICGIVHSHPGSIPYPSDADVNLFGKYGHTHVIIAEPYNWESWRAFDHRGEQIRLEVVD